MSKRWEFVRRDERPESYDLCIDRWAQAYRLYPEDIRAICDAANEVLGKAYSIPSRPHTPRPGVRDSGSEMGPEISKGGEPPVHARGETPALAFDEEVFVRDVASRLFESDWLPRWAPEAIDSDVLARECVRAARALAKALKEKP